MGKSVVKFGVWAFTALTGLASIIRWILDAIGTAQTAEGVYQNRGPILNWFSTISQAWPVGLFALGVVGLACIQFGPPNHWFKIADIHLVPFGTKLTESNGKHRLVIGIKNTGKASALDTQITLVFWRCSGERAPYAVEKSVGNPISKHTPEQIEIEFEFVPIEPVFIALTFAYRSRRAGKRREQDPPFYYRWDGASSALTHASSEERDRIQDRLETGVPVNAGTTGEAMSLDQVLKLGAVLDRVSEHIERKRDTGGSVTLAKIAEAHVPKPVRIEKSPFNRQAVLIKVRDLVVSTEKQPSSERFDVIGALIKFADEFETEEQVEWVCAELEQRQFKDPFKIMASAVPGIFDGRKLEFLCDARTAKMEIRTTMSAMSFVAKYWRHSDEFNKAHRAHFEPPTHAQGQRESRAMLNAIVDKLSAGVKPLRALQEVHADELETNDMLLQVRDDLIKFRRTDPFQNIKDTIPEDRLLEFLQAARLQGLNLSDELQLLDLLQEKSPHIKPVEPAPKIFFREPTPQPIAEESRDSICRKIKELIEGGEELLARMMMRFPQMEAKFNQWSQRCEEHLRDFLSEDAVKLFRSPARIPPESNPVGGVTAAMLGEQWNAQRHLYERIASRVARLREILNRVKGGGLC